MNTIATLVSGQDMMFIFLIVVVLFGAKKLPELAKGMGQAMREFNNAKDNIEREISKPAKELAIQPAPNQQPYTLTNVPPTVPEEDPASLTPMV